VFGTKAILDPVDQNPRLVELLQIYHLHCSWCCVARTKRSSGCLCCPWERKVVMWLLYWSWQCPRDAALFTGQAAAPNPSFLAVYCCC